jgi:hypothetical protein
MTLFPDENDDLLSLGTLEGDETEDDVGAVDPSLLGKSVVTGTDWTSDTILKQLEKGNIVLDPVFQRRDAWNDKRKSKFIESLILGLPIPQIVLAESQENRGTFIVIDGKQRLLALQRFAGKLTEPNQIALKLSGLTVRQDLNGTAFNQMQSEAHLSSYLSAFENSTIRTVVVRNWQNEKVLYVIFHRLNTTSVPLSPQELRQALHPGDFLRFAAKYSEKSTGLWRVLNLTKPDFRMRDVELLVRYFAYKNSVEDYPGNLKEFLDATCKSLNKSWKQRKDELREQAEELEKAIEAVYKIFGPTSAFRKWDGNNFERRFNRALFDVMVYYFSQKQVRKAAIEERKSVKGAFKDLCSHDEGFRRSIEPSTKNLESNSIRFSHWGATLSKVLPIKVRIPKLSRLSSR